jgi:cytochrome c
MHTGRLASIAIAAVCAAVAAGSSVAQRGPGNPARGHDLAARLCTNCHVIDRGTSGPIRADVPSFPTIANRAGSTEEHLAGKIIVPHPAMPGISLSAEDIRDIVAYIVSLQRKD